MRFQTKTEYAIVCLINMAKHYEPQRVMALEEIAKAEHYPIDFMKKIFQKLRKSGIVTSQQGKNGGYALSKPPSEITLKEVIDGLEGATFEVFCNDPVAEGIVCTHLCLCGMKPIWRKTKKLLDEFYQTVTLEDLAKETTMFDNVTLMKEGRAV